jgi:hypothetical protein
MDLYLSNLMYLTYFTAGATLNANSTNFGMAATIPLNHVTKFKLFDRTPQ